MNKFLIFIGSFFLLFSCRPASDKTAELRIVYNVYYDTLNGNYEIFSMNLDGSDKRNISNTAGIDWVYAAYKDKVYFVSDRDTTYRFYFLYEMDVFGNNVRKVTDLRLEDSWFGFRNNGRELIASARIGKEIRNQLYAINIETGSYTPVAQDTASSFNSPIYSPDGSKIVYRFRKNRRNFQTEKAELWIMDADGKNAKQLTHYPESDTTAEWHAYHAGAPFWERNQNVISYMSFQKGNYSIFVIKPDGTGVKQLTGDGVNEGWHAWSPDGNWIAYDGSDLENMNYDIYIMQSNRTDVRKITDGWQFEQAPVFAGVKK